MGIEGSYHFRRVSDAVTTSGVVGARRLATLRAEGYDTVIDLLPADSQYAVADEAEIVRAQGIDYVHIPVDFAAPTADDLQSFVEAMDGRVGQRIHIHCAANFRVSAFYGLYAERRGLCSAEEADALVHDVWDPSEHPVWARFIADQRSAHRRT